MSGKGKEEARARMMAALREEDPVPPAAVAVAAPVAVPVDVDRRDPVRPPVFERSQEPPAEVPGMSSSILGGLGPARRSLKDDPGKRLKGLYLDLAVISDLEDTAALAGSDASRLANELLRSALAGGGTDAEFRELVKLMAERKRARGGR